MTNFSEFYRLGNYEEAIGRLEDLEEIDGLLIAKIGKIRIILPKGLEQSLLQLVGQSIAILRTDIPERQYLFRILDLGITTSEDCSSK